MLPAPVRRSLRRVIAGVRLKQLRSVDELDAELDRVEQAFRISADAGRRAFSSFYLSAPRDLPSDADSAEYRDAQFALYFKISGRAQYQIENEHSPFDLELASHTPFPYQTGSATVVGDQLISQGFLLKALPVAPPAEIVEFGPGWGNTTSHLVKTGYRVTAVEVDPKFCELLRRRCAEHANNLSVVQGDMLAFKSETKFDVAIFFESFHHCTDHVQLLRNVRDMLRPEGSILFGAEPVADFPQPWGVRLDGESLWAMRKYGWLELGFDREYFFRLLRREGFDVTRTHSPDLGHISEVIIARKRA